MVQTLLDALEKPSSPDSHTTWPTVECRHVNFRLSDSIEDIGRRPWSKLALALKCCLQAMALRLRHGADTLFYIPAPALRNAVYRDWLVMLCCRPFFRRRIYWWQAAGLGHWLQTQARPWERRFTHWLLDRPDLSIIPGPETGPDAQAVASRRVAIVANAIPDPCPQDAADLVQAKARRRFQIARELGRTPANAPDLGSPVRFRLLFLSLCYREKGLFDAIEAVALVNRRLAESGTRLRVELGVAGRFYLAAEQAEFERRIQQADLSLEPTGLSNLGGPVHQAMPPPAIHYHGFAQGELKDRLFREADCLVFPTYYAAETFGLVVLEAMAYGLDVISTRWRNIPELLPRDHPTLVEPKDPGAIAEAIHRLLREYGGATLRRHYEARYSATRFRENMLAALQTLTTG
jgi:glycosyltransferase involved in cell wall biosynthesis